MSRLLASMRLAMVGYLPRELVEAPDQAGDDVEDQDDQDQREGSAPQAVDGVVRHRTGDPVAVRVEVILHSAGGQAGVLELLADQRGQRRLCTVEQVAVRAVRDAHEDQQWGRLPG